MPKNDAKNDERGDVTRISGASKTATRWRTTRPGLFTLVAAGAVAAACSTPPTGSSQTTGSPSPASPAKSAFVPLPRNLHVLARPELDQGRMDGSLPQAGSIYFRPSAQQRADRDKLLEDVQNPASPSYHKWLGADEYAARFGARPSDIARVSAWLESQGLVVDGPSRTGSRVGFRGKTSEVEQAFRTEMHHYVVNGQKHFAMSKAPSVPSELADVVLGLRGFHDFRPVAPRHAKPQYADPSGLTLGPADFAVLYNTKPLLTAGTTGTGVNLVIIGQTFYNPTDISTFRTKFGLTVTEKDVLVPGTGTSAVNNPNDEGETELDLEWASAVAPGANIIFVYTGNNTTNFGVNDSVAYAIEQGDRLIPGTGNGAAQIISESYGGCEVGYPADADYDGEIAAAANLEGITYVAASGDAGAAGCAPFGIGGLNVGPPASLPGVTAVGGTEFPAAAQAAPFFVNSLAVSYPVQGGVSLETPWNDGAGGGAAGGGKSILFPKPFYQQGGITPNDNARDVPDVSLTASAQNVGYECYENGAYAPIGGTSASTPAFAGILAMVNQAVHAKGGPLGLGNANPMLYTLAKSTPAAFHDIVTGNNDSACTTATDPNCPASGTYGGYAAGPGYDLASGLGTIDANNLVNAWAALAPTTTALTATPTTATVNTGVALVANVASTSTANAMGGTVTFTFETFAGSAGSPYNGDSGGPDSTWLLGTVPVTPGSGGGSARLVTEIPPGLYGQAYVVAMYNGDPHFGASVSSKVAVAVTGSTLAIAPATITLAPGQQTSFATTGGVPPVLWGILGTDTTCIITGSGATAVQNCSQIVAKNGTDGYFQAGGTAGSVNVLAIDTQGQEAIVKVTVAGAAVDGGPFPTFDAGPTGGPGNGPPVIFDAAVPPDANGSGGDGGPVDDGGGVVVDGGGGGLDSGGSGGGTPPTTGCSCVAAGSRADSRTQMGAIGGVLFGLVAFGRRRRARA